MYCSSDVDLSVQRVIGLLSSAGARALVVSSMQAQILLASGNPSTLSESPSPVCSLSPHFGLGFGVGSSVDRIAVRHLAAASFDACVRLCVALLAQADGRRDFPCAAVLLQLSAYIQR